MSELLNGPIELAMRALVLLEAAAPEPLSRERLALLDHAIIHSGQLGGPASTHPALAHSIAELGMKRIVLDRGLLLLLRANLAAVTGLTGELLLVAGDGSHNFLNRLESPHVAALRGCASWAWITYGPLSTGELSRALGATLTPLPRDGNLSES